MKTKEKLKATAEHLIPKTEVELKNFVRSYVTISESNPTPFSITKNADRTEPFSQSKMIRIDPNGIFPDGLRIFPQKNFNLLSFDYSTV